MENDTYRIPLSLSNPRHEVRPVGTFHWTSDAANTLWLTGWIPGTEGEYISTCLGLCMMAMMMRGLGGIEAFITARLRTRDYYQLPPVILLWKKRRGSLRRNLITRSRREASSSQTIASSQVNNAFVGCQTPSTY
ncbi:hypothetical protein BJV82DRAFT_593434 [Fennellomyces sp. T-0311]|nr:hypothetical protein BJV82DRAFT_593434 [Fennellomyces sp. T-0311]